MSIILKINCGLVKKVLVVSLWLIFSSLPLYGIYVQEWTISTYDVKGDCHMGYFSGNYTCSSNNNPKDQNAFYSYHPSEIRGFEYGFIVIECLQQIGLFLVMNYSRGWIKVQCTDNRNGVSSEWS